MFLLESRRFNGYRTISTRHILIPPQFWNCIFFSSCLLVFVVKCQGFLSML